MLMQRLKFDAVSIRERAGTNERNIVKMDHVIVVRFEQALDFALEERLSSLLGC